MQYLHNPNRASGFAAADGDDTALGQPDRKILVTGSLDAITLRDVANGAFLLNLDTSTKDVRQWSRMPGAIAFTPDSKRLISTDDQRKRLQRVHLGRRHRQRTAKVRVRSGRISSISVSADGAMFATASEYSTVMLWWLEKP